MLTLANLCIVIVFVIAVNACVISRQIPYKKTSTMEIGGEDDLGYAKRNKAKQSKAKQSKAGIPWRKDAFMTAALAL